MHRFYIEPPREAAPGSCLELPPHQSHQIHRVLRLRAADEVILFWEDGTEWVAELESVDARSCRVCLREPREPQVELARPLVMAVALLKGDRLEMVTQKLTELGAARIIFWRAERSIAAPEPGAWRRRMERMGRVAVEAAEQSGRLVIPTLEGVTELADLLTEKVEWRVADLHASRLMTASPRRSGPVGAIIGPEGGLTPVELEAAVAAGATPISLGRSVLRAETAVLAAAVLLAAEIEGARPDGV